MSEFKALEISKALELAGKDFAKVAGGDFWKSSAKELAEGAVQESASVIQTALEDASKTLKTEGKMTFKDGSKLTTDEFMKLFTGDASKAGVKAIERDSVKAMTKILGKDLDKLTAENLKTLDKAWNNVVNGRLESEVISQVGKDIATIPDRALSKVESSAAEIAEKTAKEEVEKLMKKSLEDTKKFEKFEKELEALKKASADGEKSVSRGKWVKTAAGVVAAGATMYALYSLVEEHKNAINGCWLVCSNGMKWKIKPLSGKDNQVAPSGVFYGLGAGGLSSFTFGNSDGVMYDGGNPVEINPSSNERDFGYNPCIFGDDRTNLPLTSYKCNDSNDSSDCCTTSYGDILVPLEECEDADNQTYTITQCPPYANEPATDPDPVNATSVSSDETSEACHTYCSSEYLRPPGPMEDEAKNAVSFAIVCKNVSWLEAGGDWLPDPLGPFEDLFGTVMKYVKIIIVVFVCVWLILFLSKFIKRRRQSNKN